MTNKISVLLVEKAEADALLLVRALETGSYAPDWLRVATAEAAYQALKEKHWDIILSDLSTPHFGISEVLKLRDRLAPDTPVIAVSGSHESVAAANSLPPGVQDCVSKSDLERLPLAVERALADIRVRRKHWEAEQKLEENTRLNQVLLDAFPHPIMLLQPHTYKIIVSNKAARDSGAGIGSHCFAAWGRQDKPCAWCLAAELWKTGKPQHREVQWMNHWWDAYWFPVDKDHYMHFIYDITERKNNELRITHLNSVISLVRDVNELIVGLNDEASLLAQVCKRMVDGTDYELAWVGLKDREGRMSPVAQAGQTIDFKKCLGVIDCAPVGDGGSRMHHKCIFKLFEASISLPLTVEKESIGVLNICSCNSGAFQGEELRQVNELAADLSLGIEKIRKREELRLRNQYIEKVIDNLPIGLAVNTISDGKTRFTNSKFEEIYGWTRDDMSDVAGFFEKVYPDPAYRRTIQERVSADIQSGDPDRMRWDDVIITTKTGERRTISAANIPIPEQDLMISTVQDITARKAAEADVKLRARLLDAVSDSVFLSEPDGKILYLNESAYKTRGFTHDELLGANIKMLRPSEALLDWDERRRAIVERGEASYESSHIRKDGSIMLIEVHARAIHHSGQNLILSVVRDITQRKKIENQMVITDRLASVGELASGIAHEVNNPLTGVIGFAQLLLEKDLPPDVLEDLTIIHDEAERASEVLKNLLSFARNQVPHKNRVGLNGIIERVLKLRAYEHRIDNISVDTKLSPDLPEVYADSAQLQQCFLNIVINAEHFMKKAHHRGLLSVETQRVNGNVQVSFRDDGPGIPADAIGHIFDPFFTTKDVGEGTGLGLSICHGLIESHGGRIWAESQPGQGATFIIELPAALPGFGEAEKS